MKFKKYTNIVHLFISIILSFIISFIIYESINEVIISYLLSNAIAILIYVILSIIHFIKVHNYKNVIAKIIKCESIFTNVYQLTYEFEVDGVKKTAVYNCTQKKEIGETEELFISGSDNLILKRNIMLFGKLGLVVFALIAVTFMILSIYFKYNPVDLLVKQSYDLILLFKFSNILFILSITFIIEVIKKKKIKYVIVEGKSKTDKTVSNIKLKERTFNIINNVPTYEYVWKGEIKEYTPQNYNTDKINPIKKLYVDSNGNVIYEKSEINLLLTLGIVFLSFYLFALIGLFGGNFGVTIWAIFAIILFIIMTLFIAFRGLIKRIIRNIKCKVVVDAIVIEHKKYRIRKTNEVGAGWYYAPIYEFVYNGKKYKAEYNDYITEKFLLPKVGKKIKLHIDSNNPEFVVYKKDFIPYISFVLLYGIFMLEIYGLVLIISTL